MSSCRVSAAVATAAMMVLSAPAHAQLTTGDEVPPPGAVSNAPDAASKPYRRTPDSWSQFDSAISGDGRGVPATHPAVQPLLAQHPDRDLILCLAGCGGGGVKVVSLRPRGAAVVAASLGRSVPTSTEAKPAAVAKPAALSAPEGGEVYDVICVAGCNGRPGEVVGRNVRLSWVDDAAGEALKTALRRIAERVGRGEPEVEEPALRPFMSSNARAALIEASDGRHGAFASLPGR